MSYKNSISRPVRLRQARSAKRQQQTRLMVLGAAVFSLTIGCATRENAAPARQASIESARDSEAIAALDKMGRFLRGLKTFSLTAQTATDEILDTGQKLQFGGTLNIHVQAPSRLRIDVASDLRDRQYFYDGKSVTLFAQRVNYYATFPAPPTIRETLEVADERYGLEFPLADLFFWGTDKGGVSDIRQAIHIGEARIGDSECDHYAFRQKDVDWQIWIEKSQTPLPRKLVITTTSERSQPQYVAVLQWNLKPKFDQAVFTFVPSKEAMKIAVQTVEPRRGGQN
jgi:hypothetical protein